MDINELIKKYSEESMKMAERSRFCDVCESEPEPDVDDKPSDNNELSGMGILKVRAFSGKEAFPEKDVLIRVTLKDEQTGEEKFVAEATTDESGEIEPLNLPTRPAYLSLEPQSETPAFATYTLESHKDGFYTIINENVPIFDKQTSLQKLGLIPLPENYEGDGIITYDEESQNNL